MIDIALLGFGTVGSGVADVLSANSEIIEKQLGEKINIKYILDLREFPEHPLGDRVVHSFDIIENDSSITLVAEMMGGSHPAYDFTVRALKSGKSVVTSNKEVVANFGDELLELAANNNVRYLFEASVGGGIPIIRPINDSLAGDDIYEIDGILNGTTNYILTAMAQDGRDFESALKEAQSLGYAEANPAADIDGIDSCRKICILAALAFGKLVPSNIVPTAGIRGVTAEDIKKAEENGMSVKLIARAIKLPDGKIHISVAPCTVSKSNPLAGITGVYNGIMVRSRIAGDLMFYGQGAGKLPTAGAVMSDIIDIASHPGVQPSQKLWQRDSSCFSDTIPEEIRTKFEADIKPL